MGNNSSSGAVAVPPANQTEEVMNQNAIWEQLEEGQVYSRSSFGTISKLDSTRGSVMVRNTEGVEWSIDREVFLREFQIANHQKQKVEVNRTQMIEVLQANPRTAMTVKFRKKLQSADVAKTLAGGKGEMTDTVWKRAVSKALTGEERMYMGIHHGTYTEHGYLRFISMPGGMKLFDPKLMDELVVNNTHYVLKKK